MVSESYVRLGVNIDHVATIRNARGSMYPDPVEAAILAQNEGADGSQRILERIGVIFATRILMDWLQP